MIQTILKNTTVFASLKVRKKETVILKNILQGNIIFKILNCKCFMIFFYFSFSNSIKISKLKTNSHYLFRIRTHKKNGGHSTWSQVLEIYPDADGNNCFFFIYTV